MESAIVAVLPDNISSTADSIIGTFLVVLWIAFHALFIIIVRSYLERVQSYTGLRVHQATGLDSGERGSVVMPQDVTLYPPWLLKMVCMFKPMRNGDGKNPPRSPTPHPDKQRVAAIVCCSGGGLRFFQPN